LESAAQWGRQSCLQAAFQAAVELEQTIPAVGRYFLVSRRNRVAKPEKFISMQGVRLMAEN
jgi:hypothetical protein